MRKESLILVFGTVLSVTTFISIKAGHFYLHGWCNCLSGKLFEYIIPFSGLVLVILLSNRIITRLINQREAEYENRKKAYETINGISQINDAILSHLESNKLGKTEGCLKIIGTILGTEAVKLKNKASVCLLTFPNKQNSIEGNIIYNKNGTLVVDDKIIKFEMNSKVTVTKGMNDMEFSNWSDTDNSIEKYQEKFDHKVRQTVGIIKNFIAYKFSGLEEGSLIFFNYENDVDRYDADIVKNLLGHFGSLNSILVKQKENEMLQYLIMRKLADLAEKRDRETGKHLFRIQNYCRFIAETLSVQEKYKRSIDDAFIEDIYYSSPLHDIGKVGIEDKILLKPEKLTSDEMAIMKTHTRIGAEILKGPAFLKMAQDIAHYHHEKWDGTGYPEGFKGKEIPLSARIIALADVYDALLSKRVYKEASTQEVAAKTIKEGFGSHFDPDIGDVFMNHNKKFIEIKESFSEQDD